MACALDGSSHRIKKSKDETVGDRTGLRVGYSNPSYNPCQLPWSSSAFGAFRPLRRLSAMVSFLSRKPALSLGGANWPSCPTPAARDTRWDRLNWVDKRHKVIIRLPVDSGDHEA